MYVIYIARVNTFTLLCIVNLLYIARVNVFTLAMYSTFTIPLAETCVLLLYSTLHTAGKHIYSSGMYVIYIARVNTFTLAMYSKFTIPLGRDTCVYSSYV